MGRPGSNHPVSDVRWMQGSRVCVGGGSGWGWGVFGHSSVSSLSSWLASEQCLGTRLPFITTSLYSTHTHTHTHTYILSRWHVSCKLHFGKISLANSLQQFVFSHIYLITWWPRGPPLGRGCGQQVILIPNETTGKTITH